MAQERGLLVEFASAGISASDGTTASETGVIQASASSVNFQVSANNLDVMHVRGIVVNGSTAGSIQFRFA